METPSKNQARINQIKKLIRLFLFAASSTLFFIFVLRKIESYKMAKSCLDSSGSKEKIQACEEAISRLKKSGIALATLSLSVFLLGVFLILGAVSKQQLQRLSLDRVEKVGVYKTTTSLISKRKRFEARMGFALISASMIFNVSIAFFDPDKKRTKSFKKALNDSYKGAKIDTCLGTAFGFIAKIEGVSPIDVAENKNLWVQLNTTCSKNSMHPHLKDRRIALFTPDFQLADAYIIDHPQ